mgnify:CR=1 FL=1|jgi:S-adenosylmethionine decarboxylase proenzyme
MASAIDSTEGKHVLVELWGCDPEVLVSEEKCLEILADCARASGAQVIHRHAHRFGAGGVSAVLILYESHVTAHAWAEEGFVSADIYTCGECEPEFAIPVFESGFRAKKMTTRVILRGIEQ